MIKHRGVLSNADEQPHTSVHPMPAISGDIDGSEKRSDWRFPPPPNPSFAERCLDFHWNNPTIDFFFQNHCGPAMKKPPPGTAERIANMTLASVYPHYVTKVEKKGRTQKELHEVIQWLTGFNEKQLNSLLDEEVSFGEFFAQANINPNAHLIKGVICGYRVEEIEDPLLQQARYLDKLIDELAKGKKMENILRSE